MLNAGTLIRQSGSVNEMAKLNIRQKQRTQPMRKSASDRRVFVVKDGVRKARSIRKFQDTYYVGLAYVGLAELSFIDEENGHSSEYDRVRRRYKGFASKDTPIGTVNATVWLRIETFVMNEDYGRYRADRAEWHPEDYPEIENKGNISLWSENMAGMTEVNVEGEIKYWYQDRNGNSQTLYEKEEEGYAVEDVLDALTKDSEEAWGEVTIAIGDIQEANAQYEQQAVQYPSTITVSAPEGPITLEMKKYGNTPYEGNWTASQLYEEEGIECSFNIGIYAIVIDEEGNYTDESWDFRNGKSFYQVDRNSNVEYYAVRVEGTIVDTNTQVEYNRGMNARADAWSRVFDREGAETLEGAIAIAESNIAEVYQEFKDYVASQRNYVLEHNGTGYRNTTVNTEPWDYNYGDSWEDSHYEEWQGNPTDSQQLEGGSGFYVFLDEYCEESGVLDYDYGNPRKFFPSDSKYYEKERQHIMETYTRENVERACQMSGCTLIDYQDPLNFTISENARLQLSRKKNVRKSKMPYAYYDVEVRSLQRQGLVKSKQAQPKSFNDMVKSIRAKNNQHKRRM